MTEQDILKYLDNELSKEERVAFEEKLQREPELKSKLDEVQAKRREALNAIGILNPSEPVEIPDFKSLQTAGKKQNLFVLHRWRIAAAILILAAASIALFFLNGEKPEKAMTAENAGLHQTEEDTRCNELDVYISPNRCWNKRELVWTMVEKKE